MAERLDKSSDQVIRCFVKGFKVDHPELWRRLRIDYEGKSLSMLVRLAKQWLELTRDGSPTHRDGVFNRDKLANPSRVAAVVPASNEAALIADLAVQVRKLEAQLSQKSGPPTAPTGRARLSAAELEKIPWVEGYVQRANTDNGYACLLPTNGPADAERAHVLIGSVPREKREGLRVGDLVAYKTQRDDKGLRVVDLKRH